MKIWIGLVTQNAELRRYFGEQKRAVVPRDSLNRGFFAKSSVEVTTNVKTEGDDTADLVEAFVLNGSRNHDLSVLIIDINLQGLADNLNGYSYVVPLAFAGSTSNPQNLIHPMLCSAFRNLSHVANWITNGGKTQEIMCLPLRNFDAPELREIARIFTHEPLSGDLFNNVERQLGIIRRERVRPRKRAKNAKADFIIDDRRRHYAYGKEKHSTIATGGDHRASCILASMFRFGCAIDSARHYNASDSDNDNTYVDGEFYNCHGIYSRERRSTHLNVFGNDMYY